MSEQAHPGERPARARQIARLLGGTLGPLLALAVVVIFFAVAERYPIAGLWEQGDSFLSVRNLRTISVQTSTVAVAALGMTVIIIAGGIDLSAGTALSLCATVIAYALLKDFGPATAITAGVGVGCMCGLVNGALVSLLRVVPFIVTLGTMSIFLGIAKIVADETTVRPRPSQVPGWMSELVTAQPTPKWLIDPDANFLSLGIPNFASGVWIALGLSLALAAVLRYTVFGRHVFALGSNESTARLCGVNVPLVKLAVYTLAGFFVGVAGLYQFGRLSVGNPTSGAGMELKIIAATVIGGASLSGGQGTVLGTLTGAAIMAVIGSGCTQLGVRNSYQDILLGVIIVAAVTLDQVRQRRLGS